jgi:hypothetical protein
MTFKSLFPIHNKGLKAAFLRLKTNQKQAIHQAGKQHAFYG